VPAPRNPARSEAALLAGLAAGVAVAVGLAWWAYLRSEAGSREPERKAPAAPIATQRPSAGQEAASVKAEPGIAPASGARPSPTVAQPLSFSARALPAAKAETHPLPVTKPQVTPQSPKPETVR
jgi:hypothetical protein